MDVHENGKEEIQTVLRTIESEFDENENVKISNRTDFNITVSVKDIGTFTFTFCKDTIKPDSDFITMKVYEYHSRRTETYQVPLSEYQERGNPIGELAFYEKYARLFKK